MENRKKKIKSGEARKTGGREKRAKGVDVSHAKDYETPYKNGTGKWEYGSEQAQSGGHERTETVTTTKQPPRWCSRWPKRSSGSPQGQIAAIYNATGTNLNNMPRRGIPAGSDDLFTSSAQCAPNGLDSVRDLTWESVSRSPYQQGQLGEISEPRTESLHRRRPSSSKSSPLIYPTDGSECELLNPQHRIFWPPDSHIKIASSDLLNHPGQESLP